MHRPPLVPARLQFTASGTPWSEPYDDVYHAEAGGLAQARHVFIGGNDLPARWAGREQFRILETGFGCGLNFLATWQAWRADPARCARLHFVSTELHPFSAEDLRTLHRAWPELAELSAELCQAWPVLVPGFHRLHLDGGRVTLTLLLGDALDTLRQLRATIDAFYLDGFSPAKNEALWSPRVFAQVARLAADDATAATWSVAASVRQGLRDAGFETARREGFAYKRETLTARRIRKSRRAPPVAHARRALIVGAGIAGSAAAQRLAARGWQVQVIEHHAQPAAEASGNHAGVLRPVVSLDDNRLARLARASFLYGLRHLRALESAGHAPRWAACGVLQIARDAEHDATQRESLARNGFPPEYVRFVDQAEASALAGHACTAGGWFFPAGGWVNPPSAVAANLAACGDALHFIGSQSVAALEHENGCWRALDGAGNTLGEAEILILATGVAPFAPALAAHLPLIRARGQVSLLAELPGRALQCVVTQRGYATPALDGLHCAGASYSADDPDPTLRAVDHAENLERLGAMLPGFARAEESALRAARTGFRPGAPDKRPLVGALPLPLAQQPKPPTTLWNTTRMPGAYVLNGFGARGLVWSALCAEQLAAILCDEPLPFEADLCDSLDPARFALRENPHEADEGSE